MVAGYAIGGGHVLHVVCDLTIAADNARFGQTGPKVGVVRRRLRLGPAGPHRRPEEGPGDLVPVPPVRRRGGAATWAWSTRSCRWPTSRGRRWRGAGEMLQLSPLALRMLKASMNAADDGLAGIQQLAGDATLLFYMSEEAQEGRDAYKEKRSPTSRSSRAGREPAWTAAAPTGHRTLGRRGAARGRCRRPSCRSLVGTACAVGEGGDDRGGGLAAALVVALALQVGTNYANDYSDGVRGTDTARVGPVRLVASGLAPPAAVKRAALLAFGVAARGRPGARHRRRPGGCCWSGRRAIAAGWFYTGGPKPYGYSASASCSCSCSSASWPPSARRTCRSSGSPGSRSWPVRRRCAGHARCSSSTTCATSRPTRVAGKRTLAVRLGDGPTRVLYQGLIAAAFVAAMRGRLRLAAARCPGAPGRPARPPPGRDGRAGATGRELIGVLGATGQLQLGFGALFTSGWPSAADPGGSPGRRAPVATISRFTCSPTHGGPP